jgi:hypothetical protein
MAKNKTNNKVAEHIVAVLADAERMGYSRAQAEAMAKEELKRFTTYEVAKARDALLRVL